MKGETVREEVGSPPSPPPPPTLAFISTVGYRDEVVSKIVST